MVPEFFTASVLAAFLSGAIAFFAPCCITFLLPAYFAFALKEKRQIIKMTLVFMLGLGTVLLPVGLGLAGIGILATEFHKEIFIAGGLFLVVMGLLAFFGRTLSMPFKTQAPSIQKLDVLGVYQLGLFSGFASSCCIPVLAGVLTLSLISASFLHAFILGWAYVLGMVIPLVLMALLWEKFRLSENQAIKGKALKVNFFGKEISVHSTNLLSGVLLVIIGIYTLYLAFAGKIASASESQIAFALWLQELQGKILAALQAVPDYVFLLLLIMLAVFFIKKSFGGELK